MATAKTTRRVAYTAISLKAIQQGLRRRRIIIAPAALSLLCAEAAVRHGTDSEYKVLRERVLPALRAAHARFHAERRRMQTALREFLQASREYCIMHPERTHAAAASMLLATLLVTAALQLRHSQLRRPKRWAGKKQPTPATAFTPLPSVTAPVESEAVGAEEVAPAPETSAAVEECDAAEGVEGGESGWLEAVLEQLQLGAAGLQVTSAAVVHKTRDAGAAVQELTTPMLQQAGEAADRGAHAAAALAANVAHEVPEQLGQLVQALRDMVAAAPEDEAEATVGAQGVRRLAAGRGLDAIAQRLLSPEVLLYGMALSEMHVRGMLPGRGAHEEARKEYTPGIVVSGRDVKTAIVGAWRATASTVAGVVDRAHP